MLSASEVQALLDVGVAAERRAKNSEPLLGWRERPIADPCGGVSLALHHLNTRPRTGSLHEGRGSTSAARKTRSKASAPARTPVAVRNSVRAASVLRWSGLTSFAAYARCHFLGAPPPVGVWCCWPLALRLLNPATSLLVLRALRRRRLQLKPGPRPSLTCSCPPKKKIVRTEPLPPACCGLPRSLPG